MEKMIEVPNLTHVIKLKIEDNLERSECYEDYICKRS